MSENLKKLKSGDSIYFDRSDEILTVEKGYVDVFLVCLNKNIIANKQIALVRFKQGDKIFCFNLSNNAETGNKSKNDKQEYLFEIIGRINQEAELSSAKYQSNSEFYHQIQESLNNWLRAIFSVVNKESATNNVKYVSNYDYAFEAESTISSYSFGWIMNSEIIKQSEADKTFLFKDSIEVLPICKELYYTTTAEGAVEIYETYSVLEEYGFTIIKDIISRFYSKLDSLYIHFMEEEQIRFNQHMENKIADMANCKSQADSIMEDDDIFKLKFSSDHSSSLFDTISAVGKQFSLKIKQTKRNFDSFDSIADFIIHIGNENNFFVRQVKLPDGWWKNPGLPFICIDKDSSEPMGVILKRGKYYFINIGEHKKEKVTKANADRIHSYAFTMHTVLNEEKVGLKDFMTLALLGNKYNLFIMLLTGTILAVLGTLFPIATNIIISEGIYYSDITLTMNILIVLVFASIGAMFFESVSSLCMTRIDTRAGTFLQGAIVDRLFKMPINFFKKYSSGDLTDRAFGVSSIQNALISANVSAFLGGIFIVVSLIMMLYYSPDLALIGVVIAVISSLLALLFSVLQYKYIKKETELGGVVNGLAFQIFNGLAKLKIMDREALGLAKWGGKYSSLASNSYESSKFNIKIGIISGSFSILTTIIIYSVVGEQIQGKNPIGVPDFLAFMAAFGQFSGALGSLVNIIGTFISLKPVYNRLKPILETAPEVTNDSILHTKLSGNIEMHNISFRYSEDNPFIFQELNMKIEPGEFIAIVGESGSGKSTLTRIILGIEKPEQGSVFFDGYNIADLNIRELRRSIGVVNQNAKIMSGSIYENITGGGQYSKDDAWKAAYVAGLYEDIEGFPMQMETLISESGGTFSGGQIQRIIIARALIKKPDIILLDEATSALDNKTQQIITDNLNNMKVTRLVIAHRLSTIKSADRIFVLKDGRFAEVGNYDELMLQKGIFYNFAKRQLI
ncbi:MAG TPA: NHLP bacteriocin export ABC transporter permease/ATPase subunit [Victivallales bacterium]|nr:NHLP bacteriocin export ABC transporter permease/ATPase subunit [Victivallales bacterium]